VYLQATVLANIVAQYFISLFPLSVLLFYEFSNRDSPQIVALAVFTGLHLGYVLGRGVYRIIRDRRHSIAQNGNAAYLLYSNEDNLNQLGFLFAPYKAETCWFMVPTMVYFLLKGAFIGASQGNPAVLVVAILALDVLYLAGTAWFRPYVDRGVNSTNIAVCVMNAVNAGLLFEFSDIFNVPVSLG
jgi:hypothetical protein